MLHNKASDFRELNTIFITSVNKLSMHFQGPNFVAAERNIKQQTAKKINYKRILVGAFLDAKSLIKLSRSILSNVSLSRHNIAKPSDFSSEIDELK